MLRALSTERAHEHTKKPPALCLKRREHKSSFYCIFHETSLKRPKAGLSFQHLCGRGRKCSCRKKEFLKVVKLSFEIFQNEFLSLKNQF